ncbi:MAG: hypothetical protein ACRD1J_00060 [Terriglobia bacterium]
MSDYNFLMEIKLSQPQFQVLNYISRAAFGVGVTLYLVGGAVRDLTSGHNHVRNLDFAVEGNLQKVLRALESDGGRKSAAAAAEPARREPAVRLEQIHFDPRRQSASASFAQGVQVDIAGARREIRSQPGRAAEVIPAGIFEDLRRRDFSANAMAVSLHPNSRGLLLDPTNGAADIEHREFRSLDSRGFLTDPSRIYRLLRLSDRLGFHAEQRTRDWLNAAIEGGAWKSMSPEDQGRELRAVLQEEHPARILRLFERHGLLSGLDASLTAGKVPFDRLEKIRSAVRAAPGADPFLVVFNGLAEKFPPSQRKRLAKKIMPEGKELRTALSLEADARKLATALASSKMNAPSAVYKFLDGKPHSLLLYLLTHYPQAKIQTRIKNFLFKYPQIRLKLPRAEMLSLGVDAGPQAEEALHQIFLLMLDGKLKTPVQITKALHDLADRQSEPSRKTTPPPAGAFKSNRRNSSQRAAGR